MYVFITKTESGGMFWRTLYNRLLFGLVLSNVFIGVVVKARGTWTMVGALAPLPLLILGLKIYTSKTFDEDIHYYSRSGMGDPERLATKGRPKSIAMVATKFGHPALYKPLMTPMVHAKARDVLAQIYRGRLHSDSGAKNTPFSDIALEPMNQDGKPVHDAPFELVPEAQQDFAYYKNRSDFREEGGDMYGRAEDLISERSKTPKSFFETDLDSPYTSRPGTPDIEHAIPAVLRKEVGPASLKRKPFDSANVHPAIRSGYSTREHSLERQYGGEASNDISSHRHNDDPYGDTTQLLGSTGDLTINTTRGESARGGAGSRWSPTSARDGYRGIGRTERSEDEVDTSSYDYFRGAAGRR